jgi:hypothetical protein
MLPQSRKHGTLRRKPSCLFERSKPRIDNMLR